MKPHAGIFLGAMLFVAAAGAASAQTIYPLNRAEILSGSKFDLKVEFPGVPPAASISVTINGADAAGVVGKSATVIEREDGGNYSAFWIRDAALGTPGRYVVEAAAGASKGSVTWEVFDTPPARAKNVILFIGDGMTIAHRTAARILSKGLVEGRYGGELAIDDMPYVALVSTSGTDSVVTDSANSMSAYTTGHKSCVNALGVYCASNKNSLEHPRVENISEIVKRLRGMAVGVVTNTEIEDATPAGMVAHTRRRADFEDIVKMFFACSPRHHGRRVARFRPQVGRRKTRGQRRLRQEVRGRRLHIRDHRERACGGEAPASCSDCSTPAMSTERSTASCSRRERWRNFPTSPT